jgi:glutamate/tyrosine decarboxylase-like PLP-dependent enzyme
MPSLLQQQMFHDRADDALFQRVAEMAMAYSAEALERHVYPTEEALAQLRVFEEPLAHEPQSARAIVEQLHQYGSPATSTITGGRYFGFVNGGAVPAALAVKWLSDFWDQNSAMQVISPICAKLEHVVEQWLQDLLEMPDGTAAGFVSGSFAATFCGLAAARYRLLQRQGWDVNERGLFHAPRVRVVTCVQAHSTVVKAISLLGFGKAHVEWVPVDDQGRIVPDQVPQLDAHTMLILQAGNVNSGAFENFELLCARAQTAGAWVHIDGAFGLWAQVVPSLRHLTRGIHLADSWSVDGHKTLNTPYDCGIVLCRDRAALTAALHMSGSYLVAGSERDGMFYTPEMSRRARIVELWATLKYLGRAGMDDMIRGLHERAVQLADRLQAEGFEILNEVVFNQVLVFYQTDATTLDILRHVQQQRICWCGGSVWHERQVIRVSVCSWATTAADIEKTVESFVTARLAINTHRRPQFTKLV